MPKGVTSRRGAARLRIETCRWKRGRRHRAQSVGARRSGRGRDQSVLPPARARCRGRSHHRRDADAARRPRRSHQRSACARAAPRARHVENADCHLSRRIRETLRCSKAQISPTRQCLAADLLARFVAIVGEKNAITDKDKQAPYLVELRDTVPGHTPVVLRPGSIEEVSEILKLANETVDRDRAAGRQHRPGRRPDPAQRRDRAVAQPARPHPRGRSDLQHHHLRGRRHLAARARGRRRASTGSIRSLLPSEGTCTIGGNLSTNAGGTAALAHGIARSHALGLEVVLADGRVLQQSQQAEEGQHRLRPARTCSSAPKARSASSPRRCCAWCRGRARSRPRWPAFPSPQAALDLLGLATERTAGGVTSFEIMTRRGIEIVLKHGRHAAIRWPRRIAWYVLIELSSQQREGLREVMEEILAQGLEQRPRARRHHRREPRAGQDVLAHPRTVRRGAGPRGRLDQARRLGAGRPRAGLHRGGQRRGRRSSFPARGRCRSAISATATSTTTSPSRSAPTRPSISSAGTT